MRGDRGRVTHAGTTVVGVIRLSMYQCINVALHIINGFCDVSACAKSHREKDLVKVSFRTHDSQWTSWFGELSGVLVLLRLLFLSPGSSGQGCHSGDLRARGRTRRGQQASRPASQPAPQASPASQPALQPASQPASQQVSQPASQPASQPGRRCRPCSRRGFRAQHPSCDGAWTSSFSRHHG